MHQTHLFCWTFSFYFRLKFEAEGHPYTGHSLGCGSALTMTTESFAEFLNKLKEIHEKEVQGRETKFSYQNLAKIHFFVIPP